MIAVHHIDIVTLEAFRGNYKVRIAVVAGPAPDATEGGVVGTICRLNTLNVSIDVKSFEICTHDHVDHASHGVSTVEG